ncbi:MAG TPA: cellulase family glycosylhydrolase [Chitinophagaceae bacterium]
MKKWLTALALAIAVSIAVSAQGFLRTKGKDIITSEGKTFLMHGTNLGNWLVPEGYMFNFKTATSPRLINETITELVGPEESAAFWQQYLASYITAADIHYLSSIGVNSIRVPFNYRLFTDEDYLGSRGAERGFRLLDSVVTWCAKEHIYVLLDMHCAPGGQTGDNIDDSYGYPFLFDSEACQRLVVSIWQNIARHFAHNPVVMGYDLLNEPIPPFFDTSHFNPKLEPLYKRITAAIRQVDKKHMIFLGGAQWDSNFGVFGTPFDDNLVYTFHKYWTPATQKVIQPYLDFRDRYNVPVYCGETGENTDQWIDSFRQVLDANNVGWHFWPYKKMNNSRCFVTFERPAEYGVIAAYADTARGTFHVIQQLRPKNMDDARKALKAFLANCRFTACHVNEGYVRSLGFKPGATGQ